jgi:hypothetical protein
MEQGTLRSNEGQMGESQKGRKIEPVKAVV